MFFLFLLAPTGPFPIYGFHFPLLLCPSAWFLVSSYNESRGFYLFFFPPNGFATLPNPSSPSAPLQPCITLSFPMLSFSLPLHRLHTFCFPPPPCHILPPRLPSPSSHISISHTDMQSIFSFSPGHSSFPSFHLSPRPFISHFPNKCIQAKHAFEHLHHHPNTHLQPITPL